MTRGIMAMGQFSKMLNYPFKNSWGLLFWKKKQRKWLHGCSCNFTSHRLFLNAMLPGALSEGRRTEEQKSTGSLRHTIVTTMFYQLLFHLGLIWFDLHGKLFLWVLLLLALHLDKCNHLSTVSAMLAISICCMFCILWHELTVNNIVSCHCCHCDVATI